MVKGRPGARLGECPGCVVVQVEFDDRLLPAATSTEIGTAVVQATQAAAKMRAKTDEYQAGLWQQVAQFRVTPSNEIDEFKALKPQVPLQPPR